MADKPNPSPDITNFAIDIQKALKAYTGFQIELADALKPWQEQWAALSAALKPVQENMLTVTADLNVIQEEWTKQAEAVQSGIQEQWVQQAEAARKSIQDSVGNWAGIWAESQAALARELAEMGPRLRRTLERADHVGRLGWTVTMTMTVPDMVRLSEMNLPAEADGYMQNWYAATDSDLSHLEKRIINVKELEPFHIPLSQCFTAYRRGEYAIAIPLLVAVLERGIRNLVPAEHFFNTNVERMVKHRYDKAKEEDSDTILVYFWMSLYAFVQWLYEQYGTTRSGEGRIFRHGIQHGTQPPPNEKVEVLRLLHALDTVTTLDWDWEVPSPSL
jgi:hypothetical protein